MLRFVATALGASIFGLAAQAQTPDTTATRRHELGLTASPVLHQFFTRNRALPLGLIYRRQLRPGRALRLRLVGSYARRDTNAVSFEYTHQRTAWQMHAFAGYEWQRQVSRRMQVYYGTELGIGFRQEVQKEYVVNYIDYRPGLRAWGTLTTRERQLQLRPFTGVQLLLGRHLTLFAEAAAPLYYRRTRIERYGRSEYIDGSGVQEGKNLDLRSSSVQVQLLPIQLLGAKFAW